MIVRTVNSKVKLSFDMTEDGLQKLYALLGRVTHIEKDFENLYTQMHLFSGEKPSTFKVTDEFYAEVPTLFLTENDTQT